MKKGGSHLLTLGICDDSQTDLDALINMIKTWCLERDRTDIRVQAFISPHELIHAILHGEVFDLFLLDILMPEMTGIMLGERLQLLLPEPLLIFLTSSEDYYSDAFRLYAFQYLCKPVQSKDLFHALDKAISYCDRQNNDVFVLKTAGGLTRVLLRSIVYVELLAHICHFHLEDGSQLESPYLRTSFDSYVEPLLRHGRFVKTHTSYVVNLNFIDKLSASTLRLTTGKTLPVSRSSAKEVRQRYVAYGLREGGFS